MKVNLTSGAVRLVLGDGITINAEESIRLMLLAAAFMDNQAINGARHNDSEADLYACEIESLLTALGFYDAETGESKFPPLRGDTLTTLFS